MGPYSASLYPKNKSMTKFLFSAALVLLMAFTLPSHLKKQNSKTISHEIWNNLLKKYVSKDGKVNYKGFIKDSVELNKYLNLLSNNPPDEKTWSANEQKAYWINAYNAFTVKLITRYYPLKSIKDIVKVNIPFVNSPWDIKFIHIGEHKMDLNYIEHKMLRKKFGDPRIHFAIVCASKSCPKLRNKAYIGSQLDAQLEDQAKQFLADKSRNIVSANELKLSKIFDWYGMDFPKKEKFIDFLNQYSPVPINKDAKITYLSYDWSINE